MREGPFEKKFFAPPPRKKTPAPGKDADGYTAASSCRPAPAQPLGPEAPLVAHPPNPGQTASAHRVYPKGGDQIPTADL